MHHDDKEVKHWVYITHSKIYTALSAYILSAEEYLSPFKLL